MLLRGCFQIQPMHGRSCMQGQQCSTLSKSAVFLSCRSESSLQVVAIATTAALLAVAPCTNCCHNCWQAGLLALCGCRSQRCAARGNAQPLGSDHHLVPRGGLDSRSARKGRRAAAERDPYMDRLIAMSVELSCTRIQFNASLRGKEILEKSREVPGVQV